VTLPGAAPSADAVAAVLAAVPSVRLHEGSAVGTHLPGRRVHGVRVHDGGVEVHAAVVYPTTVDQAAQAIRDALSALPVGRVDVTIDDVVLPGGDEPEPTGGGA
jgi:hypothetical protein